MDELESTAGGGGGQVNFIPCVKFIQRGVAKELPEKVKLTSSELSALIAQTRADLSVAETAMDADAAADDDDGEWQDMKDGEADDDDAGDNEAGEAAAVSGGGGGGGGEERDVVKEYGLDNYDDEEDAKDNLFGIADLVVHADPKDDPYLHRSGCGPGAAAAGDGDDDDGDGSEAEDFRLKPTDNLILAGHVEGDAAILEVYVYNDVEDALYIHHDILLPSFPLALEWLSFDPGESVKGSFAAVGSMQPVIEVWDLDVVDCLEPAFRLGRKASKKKKRKAVGHTDAVLALAWNQHAEHVLASGSVDQTVRLWDLSESEVRSTLRSHTDKVQSLHWHPNEAQCLATGCCDSIARVYDCRAEDTYKSWRVDSEVEKVLWNHFDPFTCLVATESGSVHLVDVRDESKPVWTLNAHSDGVNGMNLSTQCPGCLVTVSSDKTLKVWDIGSSQPTCVQEMNPKLGRLHALDVCPDAPFVVVVGGDKPDNNFKVMDVRQNAAVRSRFGSRRLRNPLGCADFGFETADDAERQQAANTATVKTHDFAASGGTVEMTESSAVTSATNGSSEASTSQKPQSSSGGAAAKFKKKEKKKKKKKNF